MKRKLNLRNIITMVIFLLTMGCASVGVNVMKSYPPKSADCQLDIYQSESDIKKDYEVVCSLDSRTGTSLLSRKTVANAIERARPKACKCGADAILIVSTEKVGVRLWSWGRGKATIKGIKYK